MAVEKRDPRGQGDQGELSAIVWLREQGYPVFVPLTHAPDYDLVTDFGEGAAVRVQVKTSTCFRLGRWEVSVCTRGGNRSWSGMVKRLDPGRYDWLFIHVGDGRRWFIPSADVPGGCGISVGGPKYAAFEIESGAPLRRERPSVHSAPPRRDTRAVKGTAL